MAGAGYKLFNAYDVLTAAEVNTYLQQQTVMVFASSAARTSALSSVLAEGMVSYLQDTNTLEVYDGSAWVGATGDITGLTAGTGISITSPSGPVPTVAIDTAVVPQLAVANTFTTGTQTINTGATGTVGLTVNGATGQTANLMTFNVNGVAGGARVPAAGNYFIAPGITSSYAMDATAGAASVVPLTVNGTASQTANLQIWRDSSGNVLSSIDAFGRLRVRTTTTSAFSAAITAASAATVGLMVQGAASQTANLQEWQNSAGTVLANITSAGNLVFTQAGANITTPAAGRLNIGGAVYGTGYFGTISVTGDNGGYAIDARGNAASGSTGARVRPGNAANIGFIISGETSQTADLQGWRSSTALLTAITAAGTINFASGNTSATANTGAVALPALAVGFITMQVAGTTVKVPYYAN